MKRFIPLIILLLSSQAIAFECSDADPWFFKATCQDSRLGGLRTTFDQLFNQYSATKHLKNPGEVKSGMIIKLFTEYCTDSSCVGSAYEGANDALKKMLAPNPSKETESNGSAHQAVDHSYEGYLNTITRLLPSYATSYALASHCEVSLMSAESSGYGAQSQSCIRFRNDVQTNFVKSDKVFFEYSQREHVRYMNIVGASRAGNPTLEILTYRQKVLDTWDWLTEKY
ncbi:hypothetical protein [Carnimonas bestiolae]|uniref:hypothetical protein n=1 Tax=Carnimonas bestiolae TaxID=3402172 RepID=UPI003EDB9B0F